VSESQSRAFHEIAQPDAGKWALFAGWPLEGWELCPKTAGARNNNNRKIRDFMNGYLSATITAQTNAGDNKTL